MSAHLHGAEAYLPPQGSVAEDLTALGLRVADPAAVDRHFAGFLAAGDGGGLDQIPAATYRELAELFDRAWLAFPAPIA